MKTYSAVLFLLAPWLLGNNAEATANDQPNVIVIVTDDQGYGDLQAHGNPVLKTPNMDRLAKESVRFTDFHVAPMCSPTRGQLMTGIDAMKNGCTAVCEGRSMMRRDIPTMANYFADSGYATGHFGKWHLGDSYPHRPQDRGFQETIHHRAWGMTSLADNWGNRETPYFDPILSHNGIEEKYEGYCTDIFFKEAMNWMERQANANQPFFCFLPTNTPHVPDICADKYAAPYTGNHDDNPIPSKFYGMIANLDENLGKLEVFLKQKELRNNTLLIYMSDNGTQSSEAAKVFNDGMRAKKTSVYEGGHRVPLFVRWPGSKFQHDHDIDELTQVQDILPTLIECCDLKLKNVSGNGPAREPAINVVTATSLTPKPFDGTSLKGLLQATTNKLLDRKLVVQYRASGQRWDPACVLWGKWRLLKPKKGRKAKPNKNSPELYHVGRDPAQTENVALKHPDVVQEMTEHYEKWHAEAHRLFQKRRWITLGDSNANPVNLYSQDWVGDYCDNPKGLSQSKAQGQWDVVIDRPGTYEIELRRWPEESNKTLVEGWEGPGDEGPSARPIVAAVLKVAEEELKADTAAADEKATFKLELPAGETTLSTSFLDANQKVLCSAIFVKVRLLEETGASEAKSTTAIGPGIEPNKRTNFGTRPEKPNVVLIFIDDMGYGDIGPFGNKVNKTPHLDRMAKEGNVLRHFYVANTACTPSRAALLTGTYAHRIGMDGDVLFPGEERGLNPDEMTIAEMFKQKDYITGCFGKWHLGDQPEFLPLAQGFDEFFGIPYSNDMWPGNQRGHRHTKKPYTPLPVLHGNKVVSHVADGADQSLLCEAVTNYTVDFIKQHKDEPFFCYVPHIYVHNPRFARPEILKQAGGNANRANVQEVDSSVGRILNTLRAQNLDTKTLVIFTSDNGGANGMSMGPLRGGKGGPKYEGHMREPTITWWPGTVPAGVESNEIAVTTDILTSLARLVGGTTPTDRTIDGKDILDVLLGKPNAQSPHDLHYYEVDGIRRGSWKLLRKNVRDKNTTELFNLDTDPGERTNVAAHHKEMVEELGKLLDAHAARIASANRAAGFVKKGTARPLISEAGDLPRLRDFLGLPETTATGVNQKKKRNKVKPKQ